MLSLRAPFRISMAKKVILVAALIPVLLILLWLKSIDPNRNTRSIVSGSTFPSNGVKPKNAKATVRKKPVRIYTEAEREVLENGARADDPKLIQYIADKWINHPNLWAPPNIEQIWTEDYSQYKQSPVIATQVKDRWGGFFVEAGAGNGERLSNTLMFELYKGWTGLLIEPDPDLYKQILLKHRAAYVINACISPTNKSERMAFLPNKYERDNGRLTQFLKSKRAMFPRDPAIPEGATEITVQCFPLYSMLQAINQTVIDYLSLDVEGVETDILRTIPFGKVHIDALSVEYRLGDDMATLKKLDVIRNMMLPLGYTEVGVVPYRHLLGPSWAVKKAVDVIYKRIISEEAWAARDFKDHKETSSLKKKKLTK